MVLHVSMANIVCKRLNVVKVEIRLKVVVLRSLTPLRATSQLPLNKLPLIHNGGCKYFQLKMFLHMNCN